MTTFPFDPKTNEGQASLMLHDYPAVDVAERLRYVEYFQRQLVREGTEKVLQDQKRWFQENRKALADKYEACRGTPDGQIHGLESPILNHRDETEHDWFFSRQIFSPLLDKALLASQQLGFVLQLPVTLANSPDVGATAVGVPSTDCHLLFVGQGTYCFCNYWAKVFAAIAHCSGKIPESERTPKSIALALGDDPILVEATKLALRYASCESLVGFGEIKQDESLLGFRMLLVNAMEMFVVGHELAHFLYHERHPETNGLPPGMSSRDLEIHCDAMGLSICSAYGIKEDNQLAIRLIGPLLFFCALNLCEETQAILLGQTPKEESESHPTLQERIRFVFEFAQTAELGPPVLQSMHEVLDLAIVTGMYIKAVARAIHDEIKTRDG